MYKNIQRQFKYSVRIPPNIDPKAMDETPFAAAIDNIKGISSVLKRMYILALKWIYEVLKLPTTNHYFPK